MSFLTRRVFMREENTNPFDQLLAAMANGEPPKTKSSARAASCQDGSASCDETQTRPDTSKDA